MIFNNLFLLLKKMFLGLADLCNKSYIKQCEIQDSLINEELGVPEIRVVKMDFRINTVFIEWGFDGTTYHTEISVDEYISRDDIIPLLCQKEGIDYEENIY